MPDLRTEAKEDLHALRLEEAAKKFEELVERNPVDVDALIHLTICYSRMRRSDEALATAQRTLEVAPDSPAAHRSLGIELFLRDDLDEAETELRRALDLDPQLSTVYFPLAQLQADRGDFDQADELLTKGRELLGEEPARVAEAWHADAYVNLARKDLARAEESVREALALEKENPRIAALAYSNLGHVQARRRQYDAAIASLEKALELNPYLYSVHKLRGQLCLVRKRYSDALSSLQTAARDSRTVTPMLHYSLGVAYSKLGDRDNSRSHYGEALDGGLTGYYAFAARRALIFGETWVRRLLYGLIGALAVWLAVTRLPPPTIVVIVAVIVLYLVYRRWAQRA